MIEVFTSYIVPMVHVVSCLFLIVVVLLQTGKGTDMGAVFGGGSQTLFGASGAGNLLTKLTTATAITFMITSLILTYGQSRSSSSALINRLPAEAPAAAPATAPGAEPAAAPAPPPPGPAVQGQAAIPIGPAPTPAAPADGR